MSTSFFKDSILVVAHPDDEALWFSSILKKVDSICITYLNYPNDESLSSGRIDAINLYPLSNTKFLKIEEPMSFGMADWPKPEQTKYGLKLDKDKNAEARYQTSFQKVVNELDNVLKDYSNVYTHNPWGEYGHEDHIQVFKAVLLLSKKYNYKIWYSNYCSNSSNSLMLNCISGFNSDYFTLKTDIPLAHSLMEHYKNSSCWTWFDDYTWFANEAFMEHTEIIDPPKAYGHIFPINMLKTDFKIKKNRITSIFNFSRK